MNIVWAPIGYEATVKEPRWASAKDVTIRELVPLDIADLADTDAPLALDGERPYRHDGEHWWRPVVDVAGKPIAGFPDVGSTQTWPDYPFSCPTPYSKSAYSPSEKAEVKYASRPGRIAETARECLDLAFMQGKLWRRCPEPLITVSFSEPCLAGRITIDVLPDGGRSGDAAIFRLDDGETAMQFIKSLRSQGLGSGQTKGRYRLLRDVTFAADPFSIRADAIRTGFAEVMNAYPAKLADIDDAGWQRCLDLSEEDNDWEFMDAIETAAECDDKDISAVLNYLTRYHRALVWRQVEADLEASKLRSAFGPG